MYFILMQLQTKSSNKWKDMIDDVCVPVWSPAALWKYPHCRACQTPRASETREAPANNKKLLGRARICRAACSVHITVP